MFRKINFFPDFLRSPYMCDIFSRRSKIISVEHNYCIREVLLDVLVAIFKNCDIGLSFEPRYSIQKCPSIKNVYHVTYQQIICGSITVKSCRLEINLPSSSGVTVETTQVSSMITAFAIAFASSGLSAARRRSKSSNIEVG